MGWEGEHIFGTSVIPFDSETDYSIDTMIFSNREIPT
jgi:hypothetical protein